MLTVIFLKFKILKFKMVAVIFSKHEFFLKKFENQNLKYWRFFSKFEFEFTFKKLNFFTVTYKAENLKYLYK